MFARIILILLLLLSTALSAAAGDKPGKEAAIWRQVQAKLKAGDELAACRLAVKLSSYSDTPTYAKASGKLLDYGISIEDPLGSYSIKKITELQNETEAFRKKHRALPSLGLYRKHRDAWGTPLRVDMMSRKGFVYLIRSAGPDRRYMTDDDYVIGVRGKTPKSKVYKSVSEKARETGRKSLLKSRRAPGQSSSGLPGLPGGSGGSGKVMKPTAKPDKSGEVSVSLDDLLKK